MKRLIAATLAFSLLAGPALAQSPVTLTVGTNTTGPAIPDDFIGLSFGMKALLPNNHGAYLFCATNKELVTLFQNIGLRHLRVGGTTVESPPATPIPNETAIDNLFAFAQAAGVNKIIYSLRLLETNAALNYAATNAAIAQYIFNHYASRLEAFSIGNEPDVGRVYQQDATITNFATYLEKWQKFAAAIHGAAPGAKFAGPDAGSGNIAWTTRFAGAEKDSGLLESVTEHFYEGGKGKGLEATEAIDAMLSPNSEKANEHLYDKMAAIVLSNELPYRFTEANDHYSGGVPDASDTFAGALWALDFLHWWAAHGASGVDFHNTQWVVSDIIHPDGEHGFTINPKAYGLKTFDLGSHGVSVPVEISNPDDLNLTAYAVRGNGNLFVTVINKEHGPKARAAEATIKPESIGGNPEAIFLTVPKGEITTKSGATLGGSAINRDSTWRGKWMPLMSTLKLPPGSAVVIKMPAK